jgi:hypothetical protein
LPFTVTCLEFSVSSNLRNLLQFLQFVLLTVKEKGGKYPLPYGLRNPYRNLNEIVLS